MRRLNYLGILLVACSATGCATSANRTTDSVMTRSGPFAKPVAPRQTQVTMPAEPPDVFQVSQTSNNRFLTRYFPGLAKTTNAAPTARASSRPVTHPVPEPAIASVVTNPPAHSSLFGRFKSRAPQTYSSDARSLVAARSPVEPSVLPVPLQLPATRADRDVMPTSADITEDAPKAVAQPAQHDPVPANPSASDAPATPLSTTEPQLAVDPITPPVASPPIAEPAATPSAESPPPTDEPSTDPRERPRLSADSSSILGGDTTPADSKPRAKVAAAEPTDSQVSTPPMPAASLPSSAPTPADPANSLGLPAASLPSTYTTHTSMAARGSYQAELPPPVLASPQVSPSPQGGGGHQHAGHKTWQRPSLIRFVRQMSGTAEPTSAR